jgi:ectoine hydroxylase-related dioxygenase (phytanoyl-CoA dioxygenase family)
VKNVVTAEQIQFFQDEGYSIARELFSRDEVAFFIDHYMSLREKGSYPGDTSGVDFGSNDPLKKYPRMIHMHRWDEPSLKWMIDARINEHLTALMGREPYAVQTMLYFKPPLARGQALHQDQYYLRVQPGTCIAAWMALDSCDEANGCLQVVPGSQNWPLLCTQKADISQSFTDVTVPIPEGHPIHSIGMEPGDVLFFNGSLVHGSGPNQTTDRFRRTLIGHYIAGEARQVAQYYHPVLRMDGSMVEIDISQGGGACGIWVDRDGKRVIELTGMEGLAGRSE